MEGSGTVVRGGAVGCRLLHRCTEFVTLTVNSESPRSGVHLARPLAAQGPYPTGTVKCSLWQTVERGNWVL